MGCPMCGGPGIFLGSLGHTEHYRCRDCGWDYCLDAGSEPADGTWAW
jgi:rubredoxin